MKSFKVKKGLISKRSGNKISIFDAEKSELITLNESAAYMLTLIKQGLNEESIVKEIKVKFNTVNINIEKDVRDFVTDLKKHRIIF